MNKVEKCIDDIKLCVHSPMEFFLAMHDMATEDDETRRRNILKFVPRIETQKLIESMRGKLSAFQKSELAQFFTRGIQFTFTKFVANNPAITNILELIKLVEKTDETLLLRYMTRSFLYIHWYERGVKTCWEDVNGDIEFLISQVRNSQIQEEELKQRMLDFLENPNETKQRYCSILNQFYNKAYKPVEDEILLKLQVQKGKLEEIYFNNPKEFFEKYLNSNLDSFNNKMNIHISFFIQQGIMHFMPWDNTLPHWITLGIDEEAACDKENRVNKIKKLFKALSDDNRLEMINLLCNRPWYVQEIAEQLGIPSSSVNYHLNHFMDLEMLDIQRVNHRIYYSVNKIALKGLMDESIKLLVQMDTN